MIAWLDVPALLLLSKMVVLLRLTARFAAAALDALNMFCAAQTVRPLGSADGQGEPRSSRLEPEALNPAFRTRTRAVQLAVPSSD
jgi:hypothetical protein